MGRALGIRGRCEAGFTLVELLVVMLILAVLAAVAIPAFFSQRDKARDAEAKVEVRTAQTALEAWATDHDGDYSGADRPALERIEPALRDIPAGYLTVQVTTVGVGNKYRITVLSETGTDFTIRRQDDGFTEYSCSNHGTSGCPSSGLWG